MTEPPCGATRTLDSRHYRCTRPVHFDPMHVDAEGHPDYLIRWQDDMPFGIEPKTPAEHAQENGAPTWPLHHQHSGLVAMEVPTDPNALTRTDQLRIRALDAAAFHQRALIEGKLAAGAYAVSVSELLDSASMIMAWYERSTPEDS